MLRQYITILETQPNGDLLREYLPKTGFRVFYEKHTDLYYLDSPDNDTPKLPNFGNGGGYETVLHYKNSYHVQFIEQFVREQIKAKNLHKHQFDSDLVQDALFLSDIFQTKVFCAYHDDEDTDMVAIAENGNLKKLCLSAISQEKNEMEKDHFEIIYNSEEAPRLEKKINEFEGHNVIYQREFLSTFNKPAPDLFFFGQPKPSKDNLKSEAKLLDISQAALLRLHGQFKLVDFEESRTHPAVKKFYSFLEVALKIILIPFVLIAVLVVSIRDDLKHQKNK